MTERKHLNDTAETPMLFPVWFENIQIKYLNPALGPVLRKLPSFAVIKHRGRTSGRQYETVVTAFRKGTVLAVMLGHGKTNWAKNVLAQGEADVELFRGTVHISNPRIVPVRGERAGLPAITRLANRRAAVFVADIDS